MMLNFLAIDVPNWIETGLRALFYGLCAMIYKLVIVMYNIFDLLCTVRILDMDVVDSLAQRIGLILGLVMLFIVIFSLINSLINPDLVSDKTKSPVNLIKKVLLVIVMFGVSTFAFSGLYYVQKVVIKSNVIVKLFVPGEVETDNFGNFLTKEMFMSFYTINEDLEGVSDSDIDTCEGIIENLEDNIEEHGTFEIGRKCLYKTIDVNGDKVFIVDFSYFYSLIVGGFLVYFIFMYCLSVGVRTFQLVFLEIISPMAFVGYLSPKNDNMFSKWIKMYFSTYLDLFIRIGIISFATFIIGAILGNGTDYGNLLDVIGGTSGLTKTILKILLIFALLTFAKKAPDLLKDLFPSGASKLGLGLSSPKKMFDSMLGGNFVKSIPGNTIGLLGKKTIAGFDAKLHGQNFKDGWKTPKGKFGTWIDKQRESYLPNYNEVYKKRIEGSKEVEQINTKWNKGVDIAKKLKAAGAVNHSDTTHSNNAWDKVLNGVAANRRYYDAIFSSDKFITSKMAVDLESGIEDDLRRGNQQIMSGGSFTWNGTTYSAAAGNVDAFTKLFENQQKKVEGLKAVHDSMRKQYHKDAEVEDQYKFIKNNDGNPAVPGTDRHSKGIQ